MKINVLNGQLPMRIKYKKPIRVGTVKKYRHTIIDKHGKESKSTFCNWCACGFIYDDDKPDGYTWCPECNYGYKTAEEK